MRKWESCSAGVRWLSCSCNTSQSERVCCLVRRARATRCRQSPKQVGALCHQQPTLTPPLPSSPLSPTAQNQPWRAPSWTRSTFLSSRSSPRRSPRRNSSRSQPRRPLRASRPRCGGSSSPSRPRRRPPARTTTLPPRPRPAPPPAPPPAQPRASSSPAPTASTSSRAARRTRSAARRGATSSSTGQRSRASRRGSRSGRTASSGWRTRARMGRLSGCARCGFLSLSLCRGDVRIRDEAGFGKGHGEEDDSLWQHRLLRSLADLR